MPITRDSIVTRCDGVLQAELDGEIVLMHVESDAFYGLKSSAAEIWAMLSQPESVASLCSRLAAEYSASHTEIEKDVIDYLEDLMAKGLVAASGG